eukprot:TRINITY_DN34475_c0_g1_i1.p1 TRINITY_DN34475_c0_g1~~TRINITY_DN34475_c0_g1_i1.p1  ORF type:complete len:369 (+),score=56.73 TRINITY_DN34475_c0_g1_i1:44-1150(+)
MSSESVAALCPVCRENTSRYRCPTCRGLYCSVACYRNHNSVCSEGFVERNMKELYESEDVVDEDSKRQIKEVLEREREEYRNDADQIDGNVAVLQKLLASMEVGDVTSADIDNILSGASDSLLPGHLREQFMSDIENPASILLAQANGGGSDPWWYAPSDPQEDELFGPDMLFDITKMPDPRLLNHTIEAIASYCIVYRAHDCSSTWSGDIEAATEMLLDMCQSLLVTKEFLFASTLDAVQSVSSKASMTSYFKGVEEASLRHILATDLCAIFDGGVPNVHHCLYSLYQLIESALAILPSGRSRRRTIELLTGMKKKLIFQASHVAALSKQQFDMLVVPFRAVAQQGGNKKGGSWKTIVSDNNNNRVS